MISESDVCQLQRSLSGQVLRPFGDDYRRAVSIDNGRVDLHPLIVVRANATADLGVALAFARDQELPLTVKGGGHSAAGYCLNSCGVVLDMSLMNRLQLDRESRTLKAQAGALWAKAYSYLQQEGGLIPVGGGCPTVGLTGFMLGGGYSFVSRSYGMSIDNLRSITLVTPDGELRTVGVGCSDAEDADLFWALRGGGGGNFGIVAEMELELQKPNAERMLCGVLYYELDRAQEVLAFYDEWVETLPDELAVYGFLGTLPDPADPSRRLRTVRLQPVYNGDFAAGAELIAPLLELAPFYSEIYDATLPDYEEIMGRTTLVGDRQAYIRSGNIGARGMNESVISIFQEFMRSAPTDDSFVVWTHGGGKISAVPPAGTAFPHREARYIFQLKAIWEGDENTRENVEWAFDFGEALAPHFDGAYVNYIDPLLADWQHAYYGSNYNRLLDTKRRVDPDLVFQFQQGIGSNFEPSQARPLDLSPLNRTVV